MISLRQDAIAVAISDDSERLSGFKDQLLVLLGSEQIEQLRQEVVTELVVAD